MPPLQFEPTIPANERLQIHALDRTVTGAGTFYKRALKNTGEEAFHLEIFNVQDVIKL